MTIADAKARALKKKQHRNTAGGSFKAESVINSRVETYVEAGNDAYERNGRGWKITITVKGSDGKALENAKIKITVNGNSETMTTDESGHVEISVREPSVQIPNIWLRSCSKRAINAIKQETTKFLYTDRRQHCICKRLCTYKEQSGRQAISTLPWMRQYPYPFVSNKAKAEIEQGAGVETGKDLTINAEKRFCNNCHSNR